MTTASVQQGGGLRIVRRRSEVLLGLRPEGYSGFTVTKRFCPPRSISRRLGLEDRTVPVDIFGRCRQLRGDLIVWMRLEENESVLPGRSLLTRCPGDV